MTNVIDLDQMPSICIACFGLLEVVSSRTGFISSPGTCVRNVTACGWNRPINVARQFSSERLLD